MKTGRSGQMYLDFDEYIRLGEPEQQEKAANWSIAIGLPTILLLPTITQFLPAVCGWFEAIGVSR